MQRFDKCEWDGRDQLVRERCQVNALVFNCTLRFASLARVLNSAKRRYVYNSEPSSDRLASCSLPYAQASRPQSGQRSILRLRGAHRSHQALAPPIPHLIFGLHIQKERIIVKRSKVVASEDRIETPPMQDAAVSNAAKTSRGSGAPCCRIQNGGISIKPNPPPRSP